MSEPLAETHRPVLNDGFRWEPLPDGCVLFHEATGKMMTLNPPAEAVLVLCDGEADVAGVCHSLETDYGIAPADSQTVLRQLIDEGVITLARE